MSVSSNDLNAAAAAMLPHPIREIDNEIDNTFYNFIIDRFPLVQVRITRDPVSSEELDQFLNVTCKGLYEYMRVYLPNHKFVLAVDTSGISGMYVTYLLQVASFMRDMEELTKMYMLELALLVKSPVAKKIIDWFLYFRNPAVPWIVMENDSDCERWQHSLHTRGILRQ